MRYLIAQQWQNLEGNHAGYPHICKLLQDRYPDKYKLIELDPPMSQEHMAKNKYVLKILYQIDKVLDKRYYFRYIKQRCGAMLRSLKEGDEVFLLEYNMDRTPQYEFALYLKKYFVGVKIYAMTHLTPSFLEKNHYGRKKLLRQNEPIDKNITLGSSLSKYFIEIGIPEHKISTGFHAVDLDYYKKQKISSNKEFTIITIGALQRNYNMLAQIVKQVKDVHWIICAGKKKVQHLFEGCGNIEIKGFVPEDELRNLMERSDFSLNVMDDTIGSNVITTSMAMGLGLFVSEVGSIHDYCDETNAFFCDNSTDSFVAAINKVKGNTDLINAMKLNSLNLSKNFSIDNTDRWFDGL